MKLTDRRLYQARNLEDFVFRYYYRDEDNQRRRAATREAIFYTAGVFVSPDTNRIFGVDVSGRWDGLVNFKVTADYGAKFEIAKAIDGTIPTPYWKENNQSAIDAGLLNGAYAWLYPDNRINCTLQAQAYYELIKDARLRLPPAIDWEWTKYAGIQANPNLEDLRRWLAAFIRLSGVKPILYTAAGYVALFGAIPADILDMLSGVWVASYGGTQPIMPKGVSKWDMWQFSANGDALTLCPGNQGKRELDLNYMTEEFYSRYAGGVIEPPTEPEGETMARIIKGTVVATAIQRRQAPAGDAFMPARYLQKNDVIEADMQANVFPQWLRLTKINGVAVVGEEWASAGMDKQYIFWEWVDVPTEPEPPADEHTIIVRSTSLVIDFEIDGVLHRATITDVPNVELVKVA
jgi:GH25 family lysozyme M1 (1,4-beta-N-acetylmuramidase)